MKNTTVRALVASVAMVGLGLGFRAGALLEAVHVGPPILCEPFEGENDTLPLDGMGKPRNTWADSETPGHVLKALWEERSALTRLELLRRAAMNVTARESRADRMEMGWRIVGPLAVRALEKDGDVDALVNLGFFCAALEQGDVDLDYDAGRLNGITGYAFLERASGLAQKSKLDEADAAAVELAAAMCVHPALKGMRGDGYNHEKAEKAYAAHIARARKLAPKGSGVEAGLEAHLKHWGYSADVK